MKGNQETIHASIIGGGGFTGKELIRILSRHPNVTLDVIQSATYQNQSVREVYSDVDSDKQFIDMSIEKIIERKPDVIFFATPHGIAMQYFPILREKAIKGIDLSADYRFKDAGVYESVYGIRHTDRGQTVPYGLPELFLEQIVEKNFVSNPGCYTTAALLGVYPLKDKVAHVVFDCKSGYSGAGKKRTFYTDPVNFTDNILAYSLVGHRHEPEIQQFIRCPIYFTPHVIPTFQGILATCHLFLKEHIQKEDLVKIYQDFYRNSPFVQITPDIPNLHHVQGTNFCIIGGFDGDRDRVVILSVLDNLIKGAAGQAVQSMNIMYDQPQTVGLI